MGPSSPVPIETARPSHPDLMFALPADRSTRLLLFVVRRMSFGGIRDAHAANALLGTFGRGYRRPLVLMRAMMLELARASARLILVAPCCCPRMTEDEMRIAGAALTALRDPGAAHFGLTLLLDNEAAIGALTCMQAVAQAFADAGRPLAEDISLP